MANLVSEQRLRLDSRKNEVTLTPPTTVKTMRARVLKGGVFFTVDGTNPGVVGSQAAFHGQDISIVHGDRLHQMITQARISRHPDYPEAEVYVGYYT